MLFVAPVYVRSFVWAAGEEGHSYAKRWVNARQNKSEEGAWMDEEDDEDDDFSTAPPGPDLGPISSSPGPK